jgi:hypothetical protein
MAEFPVSREDQERGLKELREAKVDEECDVEGSSGGNEWERLCIFKGFFSADLAGGGGNGGGGCLGFRKCGVRDKCRPIAIWESEGGGIEGSGGK